MKAMTNEQEEYIKSLWDEMSCEDLRKRFNEEYGTQYKTTAFHYHTKRLGLSKHTEHQYTTEQDKYLCENAGKMTRKQLADAFNKRYGTSIKENAIEQRCFLRGWKPKDDGRFKVGGNPWDKTDGGRDEYIKTLRGGNSHSFKKGIIPHNTQAVWAVRKWGHEVKIKTDNGWVNRLRYIWEQEHGPIPEGYVVIPVNGDGMANDAKDLRIVSNKTLTVLMANRWYGKGAEIIDCAIIWNCLREVLNERSDR